MPSFIDKWADKYDTTTAKPKPARKKGPSKKDVAKADNASAAAERASSNAPYKPMGHTSFMRAYVGTKTGSRETSQFVAQHASAANAHLEAAKLHRAVGNEEKAKYHLNKASDHAEKTGMGKEIWDDSRHPRDDKGRFA